jgi:hypothetical protein
MTFRLVPELALPLAHSGDQIFAWAHFWIVDPTGSNRVADRRESLRRQK